MGKVSKWTTDEDDFLKNHYTSKGSVWVANRINRTPGATQKRSKILGLNFCGIKLKYQKDIFTEIVKNSKSISDVINKLGLRNAGGNFKTIKNYIENYGIDVTHFESDELRIIKMREYGEKNKINLDMILIENSTYNRTSLKKRLVQDKILEYKCEKCSNIGNWMGENITLQLDHKNGVFNDNRIENLRFLCPNCHSQTDTFAGKKLKIKKNQSVNLDTYLSRRKTDRPPHFVLVNEVKNNGYTKTGKKYGVSDNTIRKWIKHYEKYNAG
jgi:Zn finger protein HypA/HybF involved in hydrogenase expression